ncbi:acyl-CoA thioesterase [Kibdelosporangium aridum]|uniref:Acyl-CoA thioester hydrolase n=1 Tax=Kibdelosporangium aridum TaxID=2030 RepID=A0A1W2FWE4_KIBAR|nr:thioesterase family protein [Kibdelosporangium aridum]SMD26235.1 acyl-CoA thioester hydrolase [Kibdelosporangium aridum]
MGVYHATVWPRWSDMDSYRHVNHAQTITLLEEARLQLLYGEGARHGAGMVDGGLVVARLEAVYHAPLFVNGYPFRVALSITRMRVADFTIHQVVHCGPSEDDKVGVVADVTLAPYDLQNERPRRLTDAERDFLAGWRSGGDEGV